MAGKALQLPNQPQVTYVFTDLSGNVLATLPLVQVTFSNVLNGVGTFQGTLPIEDARTGYTNWIAASAPNKTCLWVSIDGPVLVWGGIVQERVTDMTKQTVQITASEFWQYAAQRAQAKDYTSFSTWATTGAGSMTMAYQIISDAFALQYSIPVLTVAEQGTVPSKYFIQGSFPLSQDQPLQSIVQQLQEMGYLVGFDFATDVLLNSGSYSATLTLSYPRRGRTAGTTGLTVSTAWASDFTYPEDGSQQANVITEMATSTGGVGSQVTWQPAMATYGYPRLEAVESHMVFSALTYYTTSEVSVSQPVLNAWGADDLMLYAFPNVAPTITVPLFGTNIQIGNFIVGDDIRLIIPPAAGSGPGTFPRFPLGLDHYFRVTQIDVTIADEGVSTMKLTMNQPPTTSPAPPP